jgi:hypothetical protein
MKTIACMTLLLFSLGCAEKPVSTAPSNNANISVDFLFEHDGCKVYRFMDDGYYRYFVKCKTSAETLSTERHMQGKTWVDVDNSIPTGEVQ